MDIWSGIDVTVVALISICIGVVFGFFLSWGGYRLFRWLNHYALPARYLKPRKIKRKR